MLVIRTYKDITANRIQLSPDISPPVRRRLMGSEPLLRDLRLLSHHAIKHAISLCPPITYQAQGGKGPYYCVGNIRTLVMITALPADEVINVALIDSPKKSHIEKICIMNEFINDLAFGKNLKTLPKALLSSKEFMDERFPDAMATIAPSLVNKKPFLESLGINRRLG